MTRFFSLSLFLLLTASLSAQTLGQLNTNSSGEQFLVEDYLVKNKRNIIVFYSKHSEECSRFATTLAGLAKGQKDLAFGMLDVDRKEASEIDWKSPLVRQYNLRELPYVVIFDSSKAKLVEGYAARKYIRALLDES